MKSKENYYDSGFELKFNYMPHQGVIPRELESDINNGKRWSIKKLEALVSWMLQHDRKENLLYDAVLVCEQIAKKVTKYATLYKITKKQAEREYNLNYSRLEGIREEALTLFEVTKKTDKLLAKTALGARIKAAWMLHDYEDLAEVKDDSELRRDYYPFVHGRLKSLENISVHSPVMRLRHKQRKNFSRRYKELSAYPVLCMGMPETSLEEIKQNAKIERKEKDEMPLAERIIQEAEKFITY